MSDHDSALTGIQKQRLEDATPQINLIHHIAATLSQGRKLTIHLSDGRTCDGAIDFFFTDGLSLVADSLRTYYPLHSIASITVHNP